MFKVVALSDFSAGAHNALLFAMRLAQTYSGEVILMHAIDSVPVPAMAPSDLYLKLFQEAQSKYLEKLRLQIQRAFVELGVRHKEVQYRLEIVSTPVAEAAIELSEKSSATLIVMGNSGARDLESIFVGSTTSLMVDISTKPLLIVPADSVFKGFRNITILVKPKGFKARLGSYLLTRFEQTYNAHFHFIFVIEDGSEAVSLNDFNEKYGILADVKEHTWSTYTTTSSANSLENLQDEVRHSGADLLVAFPKARNLWQKLFTKSIAEEVAMKGGLPLLVLPKSITKEPFNRVSGATAS